MQLLWNGLIDAGGLLVNRDALVLNAAWRSLWISATAVACAALLGIALGSLLARRKIFARSLLVLLLRAGMGLPTVLIGLVGFSLLSRRGPLGGLELLYTPTAIILGEFCLAVPIIATWTHSAIRQLDPRVAETALTLGAGKLRRWRTYLSETRLSILLALLTAFARCISELGIAIILGGNIPYRSQTLTTAIATETARGQFARGVAMSLILLAIALLVTLTVAWLSRVKEPS
ncbi:MAG: ABC transporter permease subunit [Planctomycetales bacterium]|nr:ABC transporter permease subunit [Planctomycetales bacterium]NIM07874.1 ABC transporter permease subunit [Planctomycetales bacterium]NIN07360.1 ABC transporter permease subunit [Planctomycetales bacterium]NIN76464.1 ABC transporter permease subunit [Planctomycetales bacterium]NIO33655.1 ABC transporter permease subunit [Planctomycetales bacterium]